MPDLPEHPVTEITGSAVRPDRLRADPADVEPPGHQADRLRRALQIASHDLRTPLTGLSALVSLLESGSDGGLSPAQAARVARIREACDRLTAVVHELGELALIESGRAAFTRVAVDTAALAGRVCDELAPAARARLIELRLHAGPALPLLEADPVRLQRLFRALIGSALAGAEGAVLELTLSPARGGVEAVLREIRNPLPIEAVQEGADGAGASGARPGASALLPAPSALSAVIAEAILRAHGGMMLTVPASGAPEPVLAFFLPSSAADPGSERPDDSRSNA